jgi:hypothetical protein
MLSADLAVNGWPIGRRVEIVRLERLTRGTDAEYRYKVRMVMDDPEFEASFETEFTHKYDQGAFMCLHRAMEAWNKAQAEMSLKPADPLDWEKYPGEADGYR